MHRRAWTGREVQRRIHGRRPRPWRPGRVPGAPTASLAPLCRRLAPDGTPAASQPRRCGGACKGIDPTHMAGTRSRTIGPCGRPWPAGAGAAANAWRLQGSDRNERCRRGLRERTLRLAVAAAWCADCRAQARRAPSYWRGARLHGRGGAGGKGEAEGEKMRCRLRGVGWTRAPLHRGRRQHRAIVRREAPAARPAPAAGPHAAPLPPLPDRCRRSLFELVICRNAPFTLLCDLFSSACP